MRKIKWKIKRFIFNYRICPFYKDFKKENEDALCPGHYKDKGGYYADDCKEATLYLSKTCYKCPYRKKYIKCLEDENEHNRKFLK